MNEFKLSNISINALWDNLKRRTNDQLRVLEQMPLEERLSNFNHPPFYFIQKILINIGKELYKIFLLQTIKDEVNKKGKELNYEELTSIIENFSFFLYPGYTTIDVNNRIFISGIKKMDQDGIQKKFFSGIGVKKVKLKNIEDNGTNNLKNVEKINRRLANFLCNNSNKSKSPETVFSYEDDFYYYDNPSTLAFNNILNRFYFKNDYPKSEIPFQPASTHFWKSIQKSNIENKFLPFPLREDKTELRILHVGINSDIQKKKMDYGNNKISIFVHPDHLETSADIVAKYLHREKIPITWENDNHKNSYINWCGEKMDLFLLNKWGLKEKEIYEARVKGYSIWIAETFKNKKIVDYSEIKEYYSKIGYEYIANNKIKSHKEFLEDFPQYEGKIYEAYFKNWYTLFLESYGENVDLGTLMLLTSHQYSSDFLVSCSNWIRWIYNELRLVEANAIREREGRENSIRLLKHSQKHFIKASKAILENNEDYLNKNSISALTVHLEFIEGYIDIIENLENIENYLKRLHNPDGSFFESFCIQNLVKNCLQSINSIFQNEDILKTTIKNVSKQKLPLYLQFVKPLLKHQTECKKVLKHEIFYPINVVSLIFKEIIINALENIDVKNPQLEISSSKNSESYTINFSNSVEEKRCNNPEFALIYEKKEMKGRYGLRVILHLLKALNWRYTSSSPEEVFKTKQFLLSITIPINNHEKPSLNPNY